MALLGDALIEEIEQLVQQRYQTMGDALGLTRPEKERNAADAQSPLRRDLVLLTGVANGEYLRAHATEAARLQVEQALHNLVALLFGNVLQVHVTIPDSFWGTDAGILVSRVRWWLSPDELITISNAAALAFGANTQANRMRIARAMDKGLLEWVPDPSVSNPQQNRRVLRTQVEKLRDQSRLPE